MAKTPKKRKPQDITEYALRGIRNDIADLTAKVERLENPQPIPSQPPGGHDSRLKAALIGAESRSAPVSEDGCGCKTYWDGDTNVTIFCGEHEPGGHDVA